MKVYTKKGDKGTTSLYNSDKVNKNSKRIALLGTIDEVNVTIGALKCKLNDEEFGQIRATLIVIQADFMCFMTLVGMGDIKKNFNVLELEKQIDDMTSEMPKLTSFIYPGNSELDVRAHTARVETRRLERELVAYCKQYPGFFAYINRLSDYFFTVARYVNYIKDCDDDKWKYGKKVKKLRNVEEEDENNDENNDDDVLFASVAQLQHDSTSSDHLDDKMPDIPDPRYTIRNLGKSPDTLFDAYNTIIDNTDKTRNMILHSKSGRTPSAKYDYGVPEEVGLMHLGK